MDTSKVPPPRSNTRKRYEKACEELLDKIRQPVRRSLSDAHIRLSDIDKVVLVGGATRSPVIRRFVSNPDLRLVIVHRIEPFRPAGRNNRVALDDGAEHKLQKKVFGGKDLDMTPEEIAERFETLSLEILIQFLQKFTKRLLCPVDRRRLIRVKGLFKQRSSGSGKRVFTSGVCSAPSSSATRHHPDLHFQDGIHIVSISHIYGFLASLCSGHIYHQFRWPSARLYRAL